METTIIKIEGVKLLLTESEKNIQINDISEEKFELVWERVVADYPKYEVFFCFNSERMAHNQKVPSEYLSKVNANRIDDMLNFKLNADDFTFPEFGNELEITLLTEEKFDEFATFHDSRNPDMFWTSDRIKKRADIWQIHTLKKNEQLAGYIMTMITDRNTEIFVIESDCDTIFEVLLATACQSAFVIGKKEMLYMIERAEPTNQQQIAKDLGFKETGFYQGFQVFL